MNKKLLLGAALFFVSNVVSATPTVDGTTISWPDDGWYQVQDVATYSEVCAGGRSCSVAPGAYVVINHSTGERFRDIEVVGGGGTTNGVTVTGNTISWPDDGWYQVQNSSDYTTICNGGSSCVVEPGTYKVINHTTGEQFKDIEISGPLSQNSTRVKFEITVPAYQSSKLQVQLEWGDKVLSAAWVVDELWTVEDEFPTDIANRLVVSFSDRNGGITLGSYENVFLTSMVTSEAYLITADEFALNRWDSDSDGVSNLDELIGGTDPEVVQIVKEGLPEFREVNSLWGINPMRSLSRASGYYEPRIPAQRPYTEHSEFYLPYERDVYEFNWPLEVTHSISIDIDESGTGTFSDKHRTWEPSNIHRINQVATRTETDDSITWTGGFYEIDSSAHRGIDLQFWTETRIIDEQTRWQQGTVSRLGIGLGLSVDTIDVSYTLTGTVSDDNSYCVPDFGTMTFTAVYVVQPGDYLETTISKEITDRYWSVVDRTLDGDVVEEYLIPSVSGALFFCDY
jgi:hypothetical protein